MFQRNKGSFALESLQLSQPKYVTSEFGTSLEKKDETIEDDTADSANYSSDVLISIIGEFGKYQMKNIFLMGITGIIFSWMNFSNKFLTYEVDYWCQKVRYLRAGPILSVPKCNFNYYIFFGIAGIFYAHALLCTLYRFTLSLLPIYGGDFT